MAASLTHPLILFGATLKAQGDTAPRQGERAGHCNARKGPVARTHTARFDGPRPGMGPVMRLAAMGWD